MNFSTNKKEAAVSTTFRKNNCSIQLVQHKKILIDYVRLTKFAFAIKTLIYEDDSPR